MYSYNYGYGDLGEHMLRSFVMIYLVCLIGVLIVAVGAYILKSYGLYKIAEKKGMENAWAAWIPFVRTYYQGELAGEFCCRQFYSVSNTAGICCSLWNRRRSSFFGNYGSAACTESVCKPKNLSGSDRRQHGVIPCRCRAFCTWL